MKLQYNFPNFIESTLHEQCEKLIRSFQINVSHLNTSLRVCFKKVLKNLLIKILIIVEVHVASHSHNFTKFKVSARIFFHDKSYKDFCSTFFTELL